MARLDSVHPANAPGEWFVDTRCIDCEACRLLAPDVFVARSGQSVVGSQPGSVDDVAVWRAALACPTQSIGTRRRRPRPRAVAELLPMEVEPGSGVYYCGFNSEASFGANAFFVARRGRGVGGVNVLVDSPRWTRQVVEPLRALGGVDHVLLTHRDDVADAERYAAEFGARVWIHADDADAAPFATDVIEGLDGVAVAPESGLDLVAFPVPGHTRGSVVFVLEERYLFSGDSLHWDAAAGDGGDAGDAGDLAAFRHACWYSWTEQTASLARLADAHRFEWVLPGHGGRARRPADEMHTRLKALTTRMPTL